ncbi:hypothetical protein [Synechococcus sp. NOUM97013]|uniref:hypothetical protein n=1 Tax=Synechococcus sp. NOUM97013 TaxID=1442555 RepID=UPI00164562CB|nr:hypothetical protein [Synechococcus sp. NOUM97013]
MINLASTSLEKKQEDHDKRGSDEKKLIWTVINIERLVGFRNHEKLLIKVQSSQSLNGSVVERVIFALTPLPIEKGFEFTSFCQSSSRQAMGLQDDVS